MPWWEGASKDPQSRLPQTFAYLKSAQLDENDIEFVKWYDQKVKQINGGINSGHSEIVKMSERLFPSCIYNAYI